MGETVTLDRDRSHYLQHVLRLKPGAAVDLFNGRDGIDYRACLDVDGKRLVARIESLNPRDTEAAFDSTLVQGLGRVDHVDWLVQKTTELGVNRILLFNAEHTQHPLKPAQLEKKLRHWCAVAISACEQCGRARLPMIEFSSELAQAVPAGGAVLKLVLDDEGEPLARYFEGPQASLSILVGPEGGLSRSEVEIASQAGFRPASLGARILRFETAAVAALAVAQSILDDKKQAP